MVEGLRTKVMKLKLCCSDLLCTVYVGYCLITHYLYHGLLYLVVYFFLLLVAKTNNTALKNSQCSKHGISCSERQNVSLQ